MAIRLTSVAAITVVLFSSNITITIAQQQQAQQQAEQLTTHQPAATATTQNSTLFQSAEDSFRLQLPRGWVIHDVNNAGSTLLTEVTQGYGILAQLCPETGQQKPQAFSNATTSSNASRSTSSCQGSEHGVIDILRYPNLGARLGLTQNDFVGRRANDTMNAVLSYEMEKLQEVGYRDIRIVNITSASIKLDMSEAIRAMNEDHNQNSKYNKNEVQSALAALRGPAKLLEMTYRLDSAPNEIRTGYFMLIATNVTPRNLGTITGYSIFYEGIPKGAATVTATTAITKGPSGLASSPTTMLPVPVRQVFGSFELIAGKEGAREILTALVGQAQARQARQAEANGPASPLRGELSSNGTAGVAPATFEFKAKIAGGVQPYIINWNFGDGSKASNKQTVVHTFEEAGTYSVTVTVMDHQHSSGSASMKITVKEPSPAEQPDKTTCDSSNPELCIPSPMVNSNCDDTSTGNAGQGSNTNSDDDQCETSNDQGSSGPSETSSVDNDNSGSTDNSGSDNSASLLDLLDSSTLRSPESGAGLN